ncbi:transcriptional regulator, HxlR family [Paenibacillus sophorae]|uniref:Helix-turn-helix transcriptional regulator n=1 Tax=Paenibacillus sophorae TaxID=1333845 RepID=A0A1H8FBJ9_9BACL|nr:helix-turn-helix domain-containing protein [Paenibacillus sophorae]QWU13825.1 helix-turn-helix transcriptional regulator [Paenibacillus sophorae]SEN29089.1 transcriptional regulator, HxlR family [Paenibacillus sophorae]
MKSPYSAKIVQPDISLSICGYSKVLEIVSNKWTALVVYAMEDGVIRYGEIRRRIEGISKKMLTQTLRQLERNGLVKRVITPSVPPIVEYSLTRLGESLLGPMRVLNQWTKENYSLVEQARASYDQAYYEE